MRKPESQTGCSPDPEKRNAAPSDLWNAWAVLNLLRLTCHIDIDWLFLGSRSQRQEKPTFCRGWSLRRLIWMLWRCPLGSLHFLLNGKPTYIHLYTDSSGTRGILQRISVGRFRHLSCRIWWLQQLVACGTVNIAAVSGHSNPADIGTKRLGCSRVRSLMAVLGIYNMSTQSLEGSDDPGRVFVRRFDIRAASMQLSWRWRRRRSQLVCDFHYHGAWSLVFASMGFSTHVSCWCSSSAQRTWCSYVGFVAVENDIVAAGPFAWQLRKIMMIKGVPWQLAHLLQLRRLMTQMLVSWLHQVCNNKLTLHQSHRTMWIASQCFIGRTMPPVGAEWSPEAFIVWLYDRCSGRFARSNVFLKQNIYQERI